MDYDAYHRALQLGFSEREATRMGDDAYEERRMEEARYWREMAQEHEAEIAQEHEGEEE
jgi:hypothetical protein